MEKWFDSTVYMQNKLAQMQATDPAYTMTQLVADFAAAGFVGEEGYFNHFMQFGAAEEVAPNAYFNANEYYAAKAAQFYGEAFTGSELQIAQVKTLINKEGMNAWTHYQQFGSAEGVNPSNAFDASAYCAAKAETMNNAGQKAPDGTEWTAEKIADAIADAGMSVLEHYLTYAGTGEGEVASGATYPVADDDQVVVPNSGVTIVVDNDGTSYNGTAGDDSFYVKEDGVSHLQGYHTLDGGEGNDTLFLGDHEQVGTIKNIENLVARGGNGNEYDLSAFSTSFTLEKADGNVTVDNVTDQKLVVSSTSATSTLTVNMAAGQASVDLTSQNRDNAQTFKLKGDSLTSVKLAVDEGAKEVVLNGSDAKVTDLAVTAADSNDAAQVKANVIVQHMTNLANVTVAGAGAVALKDVRGDKLKAVNAAENTGGVTVDLREADNAAFTGGAGADKIMVDGSKVAHTLGAGDDTVVVNDANFKGLAKGFSVDGGEGTDTLQMSASLAAEFKTADVATNFEILKLVNGSGSVDLDNFGDINHVVVDGLSGGALTLKNMDNGGRLEYVKSPTQDVTVSVKGAGTGETDVLNVTIAADGKVEAKTLTVNDVETINITADDTKLEANGTADLHTMTLAADGATTVNISGNAGLNLLSLTGSKITKIDASGNTGGLTVDISHLAPANAFVTLTGSSADDSITMGIGNVITGGEGKDTFIATAVSSSGTVEAFASFSTIMDFGADDTLTISGLKTINKQATVVNGEMSFAEMVSAALANASTDNAAWFEHDGATYVVLGEGTAGKLDNGDFLVKLAGVTGAVFEADDAGHLSLA